MDELPLPPANTAHRVGMVFATPLALHDARGVDDRELALHARTNRHLLENP